MRLLLDTHVLLWWLRSDSKLGARTRALIADPRAELMVSIASFWELSIKTRIGKFGDPGSLLIGEAESKGIDVLHIAPRHLAALERLERVHGHNDPFDHLIIAQARSENAALITADKQMRAYDIGGVGAT